MALLCKQCGKTFNPKHVKQEDCSELCLANRFDQRTYKTRRIARTMAATMGYRSMSEVRFAARLKDLKIKFKYESDKVSYQYEPQKYVVDFTVKGPDKKPVYLEFKGKLDPSDRKKMKAIKKSNPDLDIRFIFERPNNKLGPSSNTRYWEWAEKAGFKWYDVKDYQQIKKDLT